LKEKWHAVPIIQNVKKESDMPWRPFRILKNSLPAIQNGLKESGMPWLLTSKFTTVVNGHDLLS
jgi:hypothetical protein